MSSQSTDELVRITIDLGNGQQPDSIVVHRGQEDMSSELALAFCKKHGFDETIKSVLAQQIQKNIEQVQLSIAKESYSNPSTNKDDNDKALESTRRDKFNGLTSPAEHGERDSDYLGTEQEFAEITNQTSQINTMGAVNVVVSDNNFNQVQRLHEKPTNNRQPMSHFQGQDNQYFKDQAAAAVVKPLYDVTSDKAQHYPVSDIVSYEHEAITNRVTDHLEDGEQLIDQEMLDYNQQNPKLLQMPSEMVNYQLQHPECRQKPRINEISKIIMQRKRSNEPVYERLHKQDIMSKKIAQEMQNQGEAETRSNLRKHQTLNKSRQREQSKEKFDNTNDRDESFLLKRARSAQKLSAKGEGSFRNPGARLYQKGMNHVQEKQRFIEQARQQLEDAELLAHCTFQPKLVTKDYYRPSSSYENTNNNNQQQQKFDQSQYKTDYMHQFDEFDEGDAQQQLHKPMDEIEQLTRNGILNMVALKDGKLAPKSLNQTSLNSHKLQHDLTYERLMDYDRKIKEKQLAKKQDLEESFQAQFQFKPKINSRSKSIVAGKQGPNDQSFVSKQVNQTQMKHYETHQPTNNQEQILEDMLHEEQLAQHNQSKNYDIQMSNFNLCFDQNQSMIQTNQTQMPGGDDDQEVEDIPEDTCFLQGLGVDDQQECGDKGQMNVEEEEERQVKPDKFMSLYNDAKQRNLKQDEIRGKSKDKECTFQPELITQKSKVSQNLIKLCDNEVKMQIRSKSIINLSSGQRVEEETANNDLKQEETKAIKLDQIRQTPAVGGPLKKINARMAYLSNRETKKQDPRAAMTNEGQVFERLAKQAELQQNILRQKIQESQTGENFDNKTGKEFFKPEINSNYQCKDRNIKSAQTAESLYERHQSILQKKEKARNLEMAKLNQMRLDNGKANAHSQQIVKQSRLTKINQIFDNLDADQNGEISAGKANTASLSYEMRQIFKPLMAELEQLQEPLNRQEFVDATIRLYDTLNQHDKNLILRFGKAQPKGDYQLEKCTFKPQTNSLFNSRSKSQARPGSAASHVIQKSSVPKPQPNYKTITTKTAENSSTIERILQRPLNKKQYLANKDLVALLKANEEKENVTSTIINQAPVETQQIQQLNHEVKVRTEHVKTAEAIIAKQLKQGINGGISDLVKQIQNDQKTDRSGLKLGSQQSEVSHNTNSIKVSQITNNNNKSMQVIVMGKELEDQEKSRRSAQQQIQATVQEPKIVIQSVYQNLAPNQAAVNKSAVLQSIDDTLIVDTNNANNQKIEERATIHHPQTKKLKVDIEKRSASGASKKGSKTIKSIFQEYHQTLTTNQEQDNFTDAVTPIRFANDADQTYCSNTSQLSMKYMLKEFTNSNHVNITSKFQDNQALPEPSTDGGSVKKQRRTAKDRQSTKRNNCTVESIAITEKTAKPTTTKIRN